jgi:hypothetical protein
MRNLSQIFLALMRLEGKNPQNIMDPFLLINKKEMQKMFCLRTEAGMLMEQG